MTRWYRAYEGTVTDAKLGEVALVAECSRSVAIAAWHCVLESCAVVNDRGRFDVTPRRVAVILGEPLKVIETVFSELRSMGMIDGDLVHSWSKRQFESDSSTERSRKHRNARRNGDATLQERREAASGRDATPPETENRDTVASATGAAAPMAEKSNPEKPVYSDAKHELWAEGKVMMADLGVARSTAGQLMGRWMKETGDDAPGVLDAIRRARDAKPVDPVAWITRALPSKEKSNVVSKPRSVQQLAKQFDDALATFGPSPAAALQPGSGDGTRPDSPRLLSAG